MVNGYGLIEINFSMQDHYFKFSEGELGEIGLSGKHRCAERSTAIGASVEYASLFSSSTNGCFN